MLCFWVSLKLYNRTLLNSPSYIAHLKPIEWKHNKTNRHFANIWDVPLNMSFLFSFSVIYKQRYQKWSLITCALKFHSNLPHSNGLKWPALESQASSNIFQYFCYRNPICFLRLSMSFPPGCWFGTSTGNYISGHRRWIWTAMYILVEY